MNDLVKFRIPAPFVLARLLPDIHELVYGYEHGWIDESGSVTIALAIYERTSSLAKLEDLALLLSDRYDEVPDLVSTLKAEVEQAHGEPVRAWLYLAIAWVHANKEEFLDPYETVEMIYADFDYPSSIDGFVRFMPQPAGQQSGYAGMDERWHAFLRSESEWFRHRPRHGDRPGCA